jgi:outer membrane protein OmpA-like peptidoglycan-associated protein
VVPGQVFNDGCPIQEPARPFPPDDYTCPYPHAQEEERRVLIDVKESLKFDFDRSVIKAESFPALHRLVRFMEKYPASHLYMVGHADDQGTDAYNMWLSSARVFAVKHYLVNAGIAPFRVSADARGERDPLVSLEGKEGDALEWARAMNRRVDLSMRYETTVRR